jgi:hypothetical protein
MEKKEFYVVSPGIVEDTPIFFDAEWFPELPEFNQVEKNPPENSFEPSYIVKLTLERLEIDAALEQYLVSSRFLSLCAAHKCEYINRPLTIELAPGISLQDFRFFCLLSRRSLLDVERSAFVLMDEGLLRPVAERIDKSPVYERIDRFIVKHDVDEDLFFCEELKQAVCSSSFKKAYLTKELIGLDFKRIDENFTFNPWEGW